MAERTVYLHVLLLSNAIAVSSYLQFVVPGVTEADSSSVYISGDGYGYWPNNTVDGNFSQNFKACLHTAVSGVTEAWLRIDLQTVRSVKSVQLWYRNDRGRVLLNTARLKGYSIRVSNSSNVAAGSTDPCFIDDGLSILPTVIEEMCEKTSRYIWVYQPHVREYDVPILEICEVQIFGCETGTYGFNCSKTCRHCKNSKTCDIDSGECDGNGCVLAGHQSPMCNECTSGLYGSECNSNCSQFCKNKLCNQTTGECVNGCEYGYLGGLCTIPCPNGYFGGKCIEKCGKCLNDQTCDNVNGTCMDGCDAGFKGEHCKTACSPGEYGHDCLFRCSDHCYNNEVCDPFLGNCSKCADGYKSPKCDEECESGHYGTNCFFECGHCLNSVTCNNIDGRCPEGCKPGYQSTPRCNLPCKDGTFGANCLYACSGNCLNNEICDKSNGGCKNCAPGWMGHFCNESCDSGKYGLNCQRECGHCFKVEHCFPNNGSCSGGCIEGYRGAMCSESTVLGFLCHGASLSTQDSDAVIAVLVGIIVVLMIVIAVGVVILRNALKKKETNNLVNDVNMYDLPNTKPENSVYDVISTQ